MFLQPPGDGIAINENSIIYIKNKYKSNGKIATKHLQYKEKNLFKKLCRPFLEHEFIG